MSKRLRDSLNELRVTKQRTPKISATIKTRAVDAGINAKKILQWFEMVLKEIDDIDSRDAMKIMNISGDLKKIADKIGK